jgi:hypothetical protein
MTMKNNEIDRFQLNGRTFDEVTRLPSFEELLRRQEKQMRSKYPLFSLGNGIDGEFLISEEERENHMLVSGTTRMGKSYLMMLLARHDMRMGNGLILFDPSDNADTAYKLLAYCMKQGIEKVILIDPSHRWSFNKVIGLNPFHYERELREDSVANVFDIVKVVFDANEATTPVINQMLGGLLQVLCTAKVPLYEAQYFRDKDNEAYQQAREGIFARIKEDNPYRIVLESSMNDHRTQYDLGSTLRRLEPMFSPVIQPMLAFTGVDWKKVVEEKYIVLVNLFAFKQSLHAKFIATLIINELIFAIHELRKEGWNSFYYFYLDEAGRYANRKLADILSLMGKSGLRMIMAHQYFKQFEDSYVLNAVMTNSKNRVGFLLPNHGDRAEVVRSMYGGQLSDRDVMWSLSKLKRGQAVIKIGTQDPDIIKIHQLRDISTKGLDDYIRHIYQQAFYKTPEEVWEVINERLKQYSSVANQIRNSRQAHTAPAGGTAQPINRRSNSADRSKGRNKAGADQTPRSWSDSGEKIRRARELFMASEGRPDDRPQTDGTRSDGDQALRRPKIDRDPDALAG